MITSRKIMGALFADCDLQVFDLLTGTFLPDIPLFGPGTKATKEWKNSNCSTDPCPGSRSCPGTTFTNYSQVIPVEASRH